MAKKKPADTTAEQTEGVNKSRAVAEYMKEHPKSKPAEIAAALNQQGIDINAAHVSTIRSKLKKRRKARRRAVKAVVEKTGLDIPALKAALHLLRVCGGMAEARDALEAAEEIRKMV